MKSMFKNTICLRIPLFTSPLRTLDMFEQIATLMQFRLAFIQRLDGVGNHRQGFKFCLDEIDSLFCDFWVSALLIAFSSPRNGYVVQRHQCWPIKPDQAMILFTRISAFASGFYTFSAVAWEVSSFRIAWHHCSADFFACSISSKCKSSVKMALPVTLSKASGRNVFDRQFLFL